MTDDQRQHPDGERRGRGRSGEGKPYRGKSDGAKPYRGKSEGGKPYRGKSDGAKPYRGKSEGAKPYRGKSEGAKPYRGKSEGGKPYRGKSEGGTSDGGKPYRGKSDGERSYRGKSEGGKPYRGRSDGGQGRGRPDRSRGARPDRSRGGAPREFAQEGRHDDPFVPDDIQPNMLDGRARAELKTLAKDNADWVARHLVMAGMLVEEDPELAHRHAMAAARRAGRVGLVRETTGLTAYEVGDYALALRELRTFRRITGSDQQVPVMVDAERGLGRPQDALDLGHGVDASVLPVEARVELAIALSGARLDLGQREEALIELEIGELNPDVVFGWSPRLFHAYADVLEELGRDADAAQWRHRAEVAEDALREHGRVPVDVDVEVVDLGVEERGVDPR